MNFTNLGTVVRVVGIVRRWAVGVALVFGLAGGAGHAADGLAGEAGEVLRVAGVKGGVVVHLGTGDARLTAALRANGSYQVYGLATEAAKVPAMREAIRELGLYGPVSVDALEGKELPYIDNLVNLLVAENLGGVAMSEVMRVLVPDGVAVVKQEGKWVRTVKPRPATLDDWTHFYYDAKGNATSHDQVVAPPERLQWVGSPRWSRHHDRMSSLSAMVSGGGRIFYIMDEGSRISILLPSKWQIVARDAFNGTMLWKQGIERWQSNMWPLKSGPTQLARRLVVDGDRVLVTLGIDAPVSHLDAATGKTVRVFEGTKGTEEILHVDGVIYCLVNPRPWVLEDFAPKHNTGDQKRVETEFNWDQQPRELVAVEVATGKLRWRKADVKVAPLSLATDGKRVIFYDGDRLIQLDPATGTQRWAGPPAPKRKLFEYNYGPRVVMHSNVVLYAGGDGSMKGVEVYSGKELWSAPHNKSGYRSPEDLIVAGGLVWNAATLSGGMAGEFIGRDPWTGEAKVQFPPDVNTYWFHHRCYIAKATDRFLLPSRTGIEFVDIKAKHWDINHWVRGACLYGVLPCNGLTYAGPHNCACYPEAKLDGMNALAPGTMSAHPKPRAEAQRLERGPAYDQAVTEPDADGNDWPTYRHDAARSGYTSQALKADLGKAWEVKLGGPLSAVTIAAGKLFVSQIDQHTVHALDAVTGRAQWHYIAGGRVDSPPTYWKGRVLFGGKDGSVYCLRGRDGALIWRYRAAPSDRRLGAFEQVESVWPVHGSVLVENDTVSFVAGRSVFLDGGLRFFRLDAATGRKLVEEVYDDKDPETGRDLQERVKTLQMPVGLNDILSSDKKWTYLRTQKIGADGKRVEIGPVSGDAIKQGASQTGEGAHIFAPMGFLDDSWFHRSYWVYGKSFAGGHNGYYQAGKYAPSGRILVFDEKNVYAYGREPQYYKWTTTMEHQLFSAPKEAPVVPGVGEDAPANAPRGKGKPQAKAAGRGMSVVFPDSDKLDPTGKALTVEAWVQADGKDGSVVSQGGPLNGYALVIQGGRAAFHVRSAKNHGAVVAPTALGEGWHHLAGVIAEKGVLRLYVDGKLALEGHGPGLIAARPKNPLVLGAEANVAEGETGTLAGVLDQVVIYHRALTAAEIQRNFDLPGAVKPGPGMVLFCSFDKADARDESESRAHGVMSGVQTGKGKVNAGLVFRPAKPANVLTAKLPAPRNAGTFVQQNWHRYVPVVTRAMAMAGKTIFLSGPPDVVDEEYAFERLTQKDKSILPLLAKQDAALDGKGGGRLFAVSTDSGGQSAEIDLESPPVWDGMAVAQGRLYIADMDGVVRCYGRAGE